MVKFGKDNPSYKDGRSIGSKYCLDCSKKLSYYKYDRCHACGLKYYWNNKTKKVKILFYCKDCNKIIDKRSIRCRICTIKNRNKSFSFRKYISLKRQGISNPNYKHGKTSLIIKIRTLQKSFEWKNKVFQRDNYTCCKCKKRGLYLEAHHIKPFRVLFKEFLDLLSNNIINLSEEKLLKFAKIYKPFWDLSNGETNCKECHRNLKRGKHSE